ncbi:MAG: Glu-tRNA(Gln) amidotransferase subunit GatE [Thaumarchaeota archaeon]|nr:Glu-tRNA(Gln) amidotransferase subunit GatE [Nitrososphaerota archaeon]
MSLPFDPVAAKLKVGLEIHQQLASSKKLFCSCPIMKSAELPSSFERRLRPSQSEFGQIDPAAVFEYNKGKVNAYRWNPESSCMVEADEEPPHSPNEEAIDTALLIGLLLNSTLVDEVHVMRKIVIDGSNTAGFQRTLVVALAGYVEVGRLKVGVQSVTLEEDAARIIGDDERSRYFALDRLGVPLVEVSLDPITAGPEEVEKVALYLGRALRSTGRVERGLGSIRQDLNISILDGEVVEVKGVQKLNLIARVVRYEAVRQMALVRIAEEIRKRGITQPKTSVRELTADLQQSSSSVVRRILEASGKIYCLAVVGFSGLLGHEPYPGVRLGRELAEVARANSIGGIIHSDEFRKQGITGEEEARIRSAMGAGSEDALILLGGDELRVSATIEQVKARLSKAADGPPAETRAATDDGETRYMRPRPGASRMYPETDIPEVVLPAERVQRVSKLVPVPWRTAVDDLIARYSLSEDLALQVYDSENYEVFEDLASRLRLEPSFIASTLVEMPPRLLREGIDESKISVKIIVELLEAISHGKVAKEASIDVLRIVGRGEAPHVDAAVRRLGLKVLSENELRELIDKIVEDSSGLIMKRGNSAFSALMGEVMKQVRGKIDGELVSRILREKVEAKLKAAR